MKKTIIVILLLFLLLSCRKSINYFEVDFYNNEIDNLEVKSFIKDNNNIDMQDSNEQINFFETDFSFKKRKLQGNVKRMLRYQVFENDKDTKYYIDSFTFNENGFITKEITKKPPGSSNSTKLGIIEHNYLLGKYRISSKYYNAQENKIDIILNKIVLFEYLPGRKIKEIEERIVNEPLLYTDQDGNEVEWTSPEKSITYHLYDDRGNNIDIISYLGESEDQYIRNPREYDNRSNLIKSQTLEYIKETDSELLSTTRIISYDSMNNILDEFIYFKDKKVDATHYEYKEDKLIKKIHFTENDVYSFETDFFYENGFLRSKKHEKDYKGETYSLSTEYFYYDSKRNVIKIENYKQDELIYTEYINYEYYE